MPEQSYHSSEPVKRPSDGSSDVHPGTSPDVRVSSISKGDIYDSTGAVVLIIDAGGIVRAFNRNAVELTGFSRDAAVGKDVFQLLFHDNLRDLVRTLLLEDLRRYGELTNIHFQVLASDGRKLPVTWDFCAQRDGSGNLSGVVCIGHISPEATGVSVPCVCTGQLVHDILNNNQVAMGYLELAMEQVTPGTDIRPMLNQVYSALRRSSDLTLNVYHASKNSPNQCGYVLQAGLTARK
jgi:PAS domain S-box-containing protein